MTRDTTTVLDDFGNTIRSGSVVYDGLTAGTYRVVGVTVSVAPDASVNLSLLPVSVHCSPVTYPVQSKDGVTRFRHLNVMDTDADVRDMFGNPVTSGDLVVYRRDEVWTQIMVGTVILTGQIGDQQGRTLTVLDFGDNIEPELIIPGEDDHPTAPDCIVVDSAVRRTPGLMGHWCPVPREIVAADDDRGGILVGEVTDVDTTMPERPVFTVEDLTTRVFHSVVGRQDYCAIGGIPAP